MLFSAVGQGHVSNKCNNVFSTEVVSGGVICMQQWVVSVVFRRPDTVLIFNGCGQQQQLALAFGLE